MSSSSSSSAASSVAAATTQQISGNEALQASLSRMGDAAALDLLKRMDPNLLQAALFQALSASAPLHINGRQQHAIGSPCTPQQHTELPAAAAAGSARNRKRRKSNAASSSKSAKKHHPIKSMDLNDPRRGPMLNPRYGIGTKIRRASEEQDSVVIAAVGPYVAVKKQMRTFAFNSDTFGKNELIILASDPIEVSSDDREKGFWVLLKYLLEVPPKVLNVDYQCQVAYVLNELVQCIDGDTTSTALQVVREHIDGFRDMILHRKKEFNEIKKELIASDFIKASITAACANVLFETQDPDAHTNVNDSERNDDEPSMTPTLNLLPFNEPSRINWEGVPEAAKEVFDLLRELDMLAACRFPIVEVLCRAYEHLSSNGTLAAGMFERMIGGGRTQIGKTTFKLVISLLAHCMGHAIILISPTQANCRELSMKLRKYLGQKTGTAKVPFPFALSGDTDESGDILKANALTTRLREVFSQGGKGGIAVTNYTVYQLKKVLHVMQDAEEPKRVVVLLDEADELYKNDAAHHSQNQQEIFLSKLIGSKNVALLVDVTATPVPLFVDCLDNTTLTHQDIVLLATDPDYVSPDDFECMTYEGEPEFLMEKELVAGNNYLNEKVFRIYDDAILGGKRSLLIDIVTSRVDAAGGIKCRGVELIEHYAEKNAQLVVIIVYGGGIAYRCNKVAHEEFKDEWMGLPKKNEDGSNFTLGDAISYVEEKFLYEGPIVVLGYTCLFRGISVRNNERVPTHLVVNISKANSLERVVQAFGRGTGMFRERLVRNGFVNDRGEGVVKTLVFKEDYEEVKNYQTFVEAVHGLMAKENLKMKDAVDRALRQGTLLDNVRSIGQKNMHFREKLVRFFPYKLPIPSDEELNIEGSKRFRKTDVKKICQRFAVPLVANKDPYEALCNARDERNKSIMSRDTDGDSEYSEDSEMSRTSFESESSSDDVVLVAARSSRPCIDLVDDDEEEES